MSEEIWKIIDEYDSYSVSNFGNIRNDATNRILKGRGCGKDRGYLAVVLYKNGIKKNFRIHRLVAIAFIENPDGKKNVDHLDGNKLNNNLTNLRFATDSENQRNAKISSRNSSGVKGVCWDKNANKWIASVCINSKNKYLGSFENLEEATAARQSKANEIGGLFVHPCEKI